MQKNENFAKQAEQAEAERPEVVGSAWRNIYNNGFDHVAPFPPAPGGPVVDEPLMTVAQHERIVKAWIERWKAYIELSAKIAAQRDAALARVAELEKQEPVATVAKVPGEDWNSLDFHRELQDMHPGTKLYAAPVAQAQPEETPGEILAAKLIETWVTKHGKPAPWSTAVEITALATNMPNDERDRLLALDDDVDAQAQHSVPAYVSYTTRPAESLAGIALRQLKDESRWVEIRDINAHTFPDMQSHSYYPAGTVIKLPAAAPGKEVPQAWLDVQAERRRQVEVEGYHGFRDSHYISYELSKAARAYIEVSWHALSGGPPCKQPESWPWMAGFKWSDGRTMLVKACALTLAEIERLDRAAAPGKEVGHE
ncbi:hypothetical protein [Pseudomonas aeruginosa]|uniref:hypothetical protein n=1 Tax=Pseudomonas aeruginosa TaxID=287 RepID=UPI0009F8CDDE|nr:hypothetical protein [Pseudomonas aeruginosa]ORE25360.1 hypothetical protein BKN47_29005 [Pseudomonas aeruginosa]